MQECKKLILFLYLALFFMATPAFASECKSNDRACIIEMLQNTAGKIENKSWRDQTYRELAKTQAFENNIDAALTLIDKIESHDTKAMAIRGIGMAAADNKLTPEEYAVIFTKLHNASKKIEHEASYSIALTYIAMAQAFAHDNEGAWKTAADMKNDALRHKAYGETAEIQAEYGDAKAAMKSISFIESTAFRNKAYTLVSKILAENGQLENALEAAKLITNKYKKSQALQYILDIQKPREVPHK